MYGDHHWLFDVVSGALLGEALGRTVGAPVREALPRRLDVVPAEPGVAVVGTLQERGVFARLCLPAPAAVATGAAFAAPFD